MLTRVTAIEHHSLTTSGKTKPSRIVCERDDGTTVEVVAKFSAGCDEKEVSLAREVIAACLAGDLGLPVPKPFLVDVPRDWAELVADPTQRTRITASSPVAFGSRQITGGYAVWHSEMGIDEAMLPVAAAIFTFDAIIQNVDRRAANPNCFVKAIKSAFSTMSSPSPTVLSSAGSPLGYWAALSPWKLPVFIFSGPASLDVLLILIRSAPFGQACPMVVSLNTVQ